MADQSRCCSPSANSASSGWTSRPVKEEIRANAVARIRAGERPVPPGARLRGDRAAPARERAAGRPRRDLPGRARPGQDPHDPLADRAARRVDAHRGRLRDQRRPLRTRCRATPATWWPTEGDETPIDWVHRDDRFGEKLATPDTSIADLIGEVDPIKVAEGRYLSDELTLHYGLVPRTNRGIFAINELPDLAERIQVGLLNVLEERDVQVRGYKIRLPLDVMLFASANPEDYTNRGRIITPLKDRFGAQIRTHYPLDVDIEVDIATPGGHPAGGRGRARSRCPPYMAEIVATLSHLARQSPHINQRSGVSVRLTVSNLETLVANATRRALIHGETEVVPRISDLEALASSTAGKVEIESLEEGRDEQIVDHLLSAAVLTVFKEHLPHREPARGARRLRRRDRGQRRRGRGVGRLRAPARRRSRRWPARWHQLVGRRRPVAGRGRWPAPSSSCSRACTCPSASTRKPSAPAPSTAAADPTPGLPAEPGILGAVCAHVDARSREAQGMSSRTPSGPATTTRSTIDPANRPCSTRPGMAASSAARPTGVVDAAEVGVHQQVAVVAAGRRGWSPRWRPGPRPGRPRRRGRSRAPRAGCRRARGGRPAWTRPPPR